MIIQEDNAPAHAHFFQHEVFNRAKVERLLWPANSPDLNMIEPAWNYLKRVTTAKGAPESRKEMEKAWQKAWDELPQEQIQAWIERIPVHIQEVIRLEGGNGYKEGRCGEKKHVSWLKGKLSKTLFRNREAEDSADLLAGTADAEDAEDVEDSENKNEDSGLGLDSDKE
jgi:hypothetical protein